jgi:hypothetical protein
MSARVPVRSKAGFAYFLGIWRESSAKFDGEAVENAVADGNPARAIGMMRRCAACIRVTRVG